MQFGQVFALLESRVALDIEEAGFDAQPFQNRIVPHPVGDERAHPGSALRRR